MAFSRTNVFNESTFDALVDKYGNLLKDGNYNGILVLDASQGKIVQGAAFLRACWKITGPNGLGPGVFTHFSKEGIPIKHIPVKGDAKDLRAKFEGTRLTISSKCGKMGNHGKAMIIINRAWQQEANTFIAACKAKKEKGEKLTPTEATIMTKTVMPLLRTHFSATNQEHGGEELDDPEFNCKIKFGTFPANHPFGESGQPKVEIYDYRTKDPNKEGKSFASYKLAMIEREDGTKEPITADNIHLFVTRNSKYHLIKYSISSPCGHKDGMTMNPELWKIVIDPGKPGMAEDEVEEAPLLPESHNNSSTLANQTNTNGQTNIVNTTEATKSLNDDGFD